MQTYISSSAMSLIKQLIHVERTTLLPLTSTNSIRDSDEKISGGKLIDNSYPFLFHAGVDTTNEGINIWNPKDFHWTVMATWFLCRPHAQTTRELVT